MTHLAPPLSSFIGREAEIARIARLLDTTRLLTLTGPGGVGKTRLAMVVADTVAGSFRDGAAVVPLAHVADPALVASAITTVLGLAERGGRVPEESLAAYLVDKDLLLVLDNFEQIVDAAPLVARLLLASPGLTTLVTSRVPLHVSGEQEVLVQPLTLPAADSSASMEQLRGYEAVALFEQRATEGRLDFALTANNAATIAEICRRLDGLPLAIELAAARVKLLPPDALLERLDHALPLLTGGDRNLAARQQTIRDTIAWSDRLLSSDERRLFQQLSVFTGGWTLEAAEAICDADLDILSGLGTLLDHSLIRDSDRLGASPRFGMLETIREYGQEQLEQTADAAAIRHRHARHYTGLAERVSPHLAIANPLPWLNLLDDEYGNLLAALDWMLRQRDLEHGPRLVGALREYWFMRGRSIEGLAQAERFLGLPELSTPTSARARSLATAAWLSYWLGKPERAIAHGTEGLAISDDTGDHAHSASLYNSVGLAAQEIEGMVQAREYWTRGLGVARETGDTQTLARVLSNLGHAAQELGDLDLAAEHLAESLSVATMIGSEDAIALVKHALGRLAYQRRDIPRAASLFRESLELYRGLGFTWGVARAIGKLAILAQHDRDAPRAARLFGCAAALHSRIGTPLSRVQRQDHEPGIEATRAMLGEAAFTAAWNEGSAMTLEQAISYALATGAGQEQDQPDATAHLTPRELDVLRLVATGMTDAEVAERLFLSRRTVSSHLTSIYGKLGVSSRAAATRYAVEHDIA